MHKMVHTINAHIYPSSMVFESRIFKQATSIQKLGVFEQIWLIGVSEGNLPKEEILNGNIIIKRINVNMFRRGSRNTVLSYFVFYVKIFWLLAFKKLKMLNVHNLELLPLGVVLKVFKKCILIYDAHELESEKSLVGSFRYNISKIIERKLIFYVNQTYVVGDAIADHYARLYRCERPMVLLNCPKIIHTKPKNYFRDIFNIPLDSSIYLYQGNIVEHRGVEMILETFLKIKDNTKNVIFMGDGELVKLVKEYAEKTINIFHHPPVSTTFLLDYTASADIGLLLYDNSSLNHKYCMPNKLFEYMMAGLPVLVSNLQEIKKIVESNNIGFVLKSYTIEALYNAIISYNFCHINRSTIKEIALQKYNWEAQETVMLKKYRELLYIKTYF